MNRKPRKQTPPTPAAEREPTAPAVETSPPPSPGSEASGFLTDYDLYLFNEGRYLRAWEKFGAHEVHQDGKDGVRFAVWAPNAERVAVVGDFNDWNDSPNPLRSLGGSGVWEGFVPGIARGARYKYAIRSRFGDYQVLKADPFAFHIELRPNTASVVWNLEGYTWGDGEWMSRRGEHNGLDAAISIYEMHLGSWARVPEEGDRWLTYREVAPRLVEYLRTTGFTHVEFLPLGEHPFDGSWGYQQVGHFAPTSRFGTPEDFMFLVDSLHRAGFGVILDWVPAHFPKDEHGLGYFDGTHLYEHANPKQGEQQDWGTLIFNFGRPEVANYLLSNALFWLEVFHIDGLRVDAVASMLYLDYSREEGEWIPNKYGGRENLEAIAFLRRFNEIVYEHHPDAMTIAEESTAWPMVSRPTYLGGLGFGFKWNMGWMHDTLQYASHEPIHRKYHHHNLTFGLLYAFQENFILPLSHDEVVHGKGSMRGKMPGDPWRAFANLRTLYGFMYAHPGKKLLFMGDEFGQDREWSHDRSLDWHLLDDPYHAGLQHWVADLNRLLRETPALHEVDFAAEGFDWIDCNDSEQSALSFLRWGKGRTDPVVCLLNFTPVPRPNYRVGVPEGGRWREILNSDAPLYGGSGQGNLGMLEAAPVGAHGHDHSLNVTLPPLSCLLFRRAEDEA